MATFELDDDLFQPTGTSHVRTQLEGLCRTLTLRFQESSQTPWELVGYIVYTKTAGQDPHLGD